MNIKKYIKEKNIKTKDDLIMFFIYTYEYCLGKYNSEELMKKINTFKNKLKNIDNLELFWYGLYLNFQCDFTNESELFFLSESIEKYIKQLNIESISNIKSFIKRVNDILEKKEIYTLKEKFVFAEDDLFCSLLEEDISEFRKFLLKNKKIISKEKIKNLYLFEFEGINKYRNDIDICIEVFIADNIDFLKEKAFPILKEKILKPNFTYEKYLEELNEKNFIEETLNDFCKEVISESDINKILKEKIKDFFVKATRSLYLFLNLTY